MNTFIIMFTIEAIRKFSHLKTLVYRILTISSHNDIVAMIFFGFRCFTVSIKHHHRKSCYLDNIAFMFLTWNFYIADIITNFDNLQNFNEVQNNFNLNFLLNWLLL